MSIYNIHHIPNRYLKFIPKIYHFLFISHLTYGISCWGGICPSKLIKMFNIKKRCVRILFGDNYSFNHPEYYLTCARARTYMDHTTLTDYSLEQTKPIFNKYKLLGHPNFPYHTFLDIKSLYTSCDMKKSLSTTILNFQDKPHLLPPNISASTIQSLISFCLDNSYFEFNGQFYSRHWRNDGISTCGRVGSDKSSRCRKHCPHHLERPSQHLQTLCRRRNWRPS